jgi:hypothetical protein
VDCNVTSIFKDGVGETWVKKLLLQEMREVIFILIFEHPGIPHANTTYKKPLHYRPGKEIHSPHMNYEEFNNKG